MARAVESTLGRPITVISRDLNVHGSNKVRTLSPAAGWNFPPLDRGKECRAGPHGPSCEEWFVNDGELQAVPDHREAPGPSC